MTEVIHVKERERYELRLDGQTIGFADVIEAHGDATFPHVEVDPVHEGKGYGSLLTKEAVTDVRARGLRVVARCPFVVAYLKRHPELVA
ncbi:N-acetyltransferase [bacterium]|nr:MAG: N-acetyltransferase [bacterium]